MIVFHDQHNPPKRDNLIQVESPHIRKDEEDHSIDHEYRLHREKKKYQNKQLITDVTTRQSLVNCITQVVKKSGLCDLFDLIN